MKQLLVVLSVLLANLVFAQMPDQIKTIAIGRNIFTFIANQDLAVANANITKAYIVVHGSELNSWDYFRSIQIASVKVNKADQTLIIAPAYRTPTTSPAKPGEFSFSDEGWLRGDESDNDSSVTSFDILDTLIAKLANRAIFPNLQTIMITGHSAGGQFTQRYALGSSTQDRYPSIQFSYLVLNPGSYAYLNGKRIDSSHRFSTPVNPDCDYNVYKYGLEDITGYLTRRPVTAMVSSYIQKNITYFLGEADTDTGDVDETCEAQYQGINRFERGTTFKAYLDSEFPQNHHRITTVPGVAHSERAMYTSPQGLIELYR